MDVEQIYQEQFNMVYRYLICLTHSKEIAEDLTQETFCKAIKNINNFQGKCKISVWLCEIAKNLWFNELKKMKKVSFVEIEDDINILYNIEEEFLKKQYESILNQENSSDSSSLRVSGKTSLNSEEVMLDFNLTVTKKELDKKKNTTLQAKQRLEQIFDFLEPLKNGKFMNMLEGITVVRSPIRRTGLLVTHENYKKLLELFEFLDSYAMLEKALNVKEKKKNYDFFTIPYFMSYQLFSESNSFAPKDEEFLKKYLEGIVRQFVEESTVDEKSFKKMLNKLFEEEYAKKKTREKNIQQIFMKSFDTHQKQVKDAIRSLKG